MDVYGYLCEVFSICEYVCKMICLEKVTHNGYFIVP